MKSLNLQSLSDCIMSETPINTLTQHPSPAGHLQVMDDEIDVDEISGKHH